MNLTKSKLKQIIKEELRNVLNEANEEKYRLKTNAFCMMGKCRGDARLYKPCGPPQCPQPDTWQVVSGLVAKAMGTSEKEVLAKALEELQKKVPDIDLTKVQKLETEPINP